MQIFCVWVPDVSLFHDQHTNLKLVGHLSIRGAKMSKSLKNCEQYKVRLPCLQFDTY